MARHRHRPRLTWPTLGLALAALVVLFGAYACARGGATVPEQPEPAVQPYVPCAEATTSYGSDGRVWWYCRPSRDPITSTPGR